MIYTIYNTITGRISRTVSTDEDVTIQLSENEDYVEGEYSGNSNYIDSDKQVVAIPERPNEYSDFDFTTKQWIANQNKAIFDILQKRQKLLVASDWTQLPNGPFTAEKQAAWATYRQALRDITDQAGYPLNVEWPTAPQ